MHQTRQATFPFQHVAETGSDGSLGTFDFRRSAVYGENQGTPASGVLFVLGNADLQEVMKARSMPARPAIGPAVVVAVDRGTKVALKDDGTERRIRFRCRPENR